MASVGQRESGNHAPYVLLRQPLRQSGLENASARPTNAGDNDYRSVATRKSGLEKTAESSAAACLSVAVQIKRCPNIELASTNPPLSTAVGRRRRLFRARGYRGWARRAANHRRRYGFVVRHASLALGLALFHCFGDATPQRPLLAA